MDDELVALQHRYDGGLTIELWGGPTLSQMLRNCGPLVAGIFDEDWARVFCGYRPPPGEPIPSGRALLSDPIAISGLGPTRDRDAGLVESDPRQKNASTARTPCPPRDSIPRPSAGRLDLATAWDPTAETPAGAVEPGRPHRGRAPTLRRARRVTIMRNPRELLGTWRRTGLLGR